MATPVVGDVDGDGVSDLVFTAFQQHLYQGAGVLRVVSGKNGKEIWSSAAASRIASVSTPALADLDGDGKIEVIAIRDNVDAADKPTSSSIIVFSATGTILATSENLTENHYGMVNIRDLDGDGTAEIIVGAHVLQASGKPIYAIKVNINLPQAMGVGFGVMDVHPTFPGSEIVDPQGTIYNSAGSAIATFSPGGKMAGFGNFDADPQPEIVITGDGKISVFDGDGTMRFTLAPEICGGGGAPNVGDVDGDGKVEVGFAGECAYVMVDDDGKILWTARNSDASSRSTGSSIFDFNGDGSVEVVYNDENYLHIYEGKSGKVLWKATNDSGTLFEYPAIVSLEDKKAAVIVVAANSYSGYQMARGLPAESTAVPNVTGVRVFGAPNWVPTRRLWNQFDYTIFNIQDDFKAPSVSNLRPDIETRVNRFPEVSSRCI